MIIQHYKIPVDIAQDFIVIKDAKLKDVDIILKQEVDYIAKNPETGIITFDNKLLKKTLVELYTYAWQQGYNDAVYKLCH